LALGLDSTTELRRIGDLLAYLRSPDPPSGLKDAWSKLPALKQVLHMNPKTVHKAAWREITFSGDEVDLNILPVQTCWPEDAGPLITWGVVV